MFSNRIGPGVQRRAPEETTFAYLHHPHLYRSNAVLITHSDALTSAAAVYGNENNPDSFTLYLGKKSENNWIERQVQHIYIHDEYNNETSYADIAVLTVRIYVFIRNSRH